MNAGLDLFVCLEFCICLSVYLLCALHILLNTFENLCVFVCVRVSVSVNKEKRQEQL